MSNLVRSVPVEHLDEQGDDAFNDDGIGIGGVKYFAVFFLGVEPHPALASLDEVMGGSELPRSMIMA